METQDNKMAAVATWGTQVRERAMSTHRHKQISVLTMNTSAFTVCFAV